MYSSLAPTLSLNCARPLAALLVGKLSAFLAKGRFAAAISRFDPYTFLLVCTHVMMMWLIAPVIGPLFGRFGEPGYPIFLLMLPIMALAGAGGIGWLLRRISSDFAGLMSGGRLASPRR